MLKNCKKRAFAFLVAISLFVCQLPALAGSVTVKGTVVNIRSGPGTSYEILGTVNLGNKIVPLDIENDKSGNGKKWIKFVFNGKNGYIRTDFTKEMLSYTYDAIFESELLRKGFPDSYKEGLRDLHANYPSWIFNLYDTGIDFNYAVEQESIGTRTLVTSGAISSYKSIDEGKYDITTSTWPTFDGGAWVCASKEAIACYMDPRNFLYDPYIFQFESQKFNVSIQTLEAVKEMVKGTFLEKTITTEGLSGDILQTVPVLGFTGTYDNIENYGPVANITPNMSNIASVISPSVNNTEEETSFPFTYLPKGTYTYAELIFDACRQVNANPYVIVSMILQEQGKEGSDSVSGKNKKYPSTYNYGNVNAYASNGLTAIENGLKYASETGSYNRPWNTPEKGIYGLCDFYANSYVNDGQDTFYLKKWNVQGQNMFKHQYMTNVSAAAAEGQLLGNIYDDILLSLPHEFNIPYYRNMSYDPVPVPTKDGSPNNFLKSLSVDNYTITPTFNSKTYNYTLMVDKNVSSINIKAEAYDKRAAIAGAGTINLPTTNTEANINIVAENGDVRQYKINVYRPGVENVTIKDSNTYIPLPTPITNQSANFSVAPVIIPAGNTINYTQNYNIIMPGSDVVVGVGPGQ